MNLKPLKSISTFLALSAKNDVETTKF